MSNIIHVYLQDVNYKETIAKDAVIFTNKNVQ